MEEGGAEPSLTPTQEERAGDGDSPPRTEKRLSVFEGPPEVAMEQLLLVPNLSSQQLLSDAERALAESSLDPLPLQPSTSGRPQQQPDQEKEGSAAGSSTRSSYLRRRMHVKMRAVHAFSSSSAHMSQHAEGALVTALLVNAFVPTHNAPSCRSLAGSSRHASWSAAFSFDTRQRRAF